MDIDFSLRFVCISDTHNQVEGKKWASQIPAGDVLLHAGDFTMHSAIPEIHTFNSFLGELSKV